jgi:DNA-binding transcriptional regulator LsrR (DeoR family)
MDIINLDKLALEIARKRLLNNISYKELGRQYFTSPSTIHRRLSGWLKENRFELQDKLAARKTAYIESRDDSLAQELVRRTGIWRARVARISGVDPAYTEQYLGDPESLPAQAAFKAGDDLHHCLGEVAAELILNSLRKNMVLGISSGRGVGFTIEALADSVNKSSAWISGYDSIRLVSLCGGIHVGRWGQSDFNIRDFDADENVFSLAAALKVPRKNLTYVTGPVSQHASGHGMDRHSKFDLDIAIIGLGQLNTRHHYFRGIGEFQFNNISDPAQKIISWQAENPGLYDGLAEIVMKLYPPSTQDIPAEFLQAIQAMNNTILSVPPTMIKNAAEVMLIAGGRQKVEALCGLLNGEYPDAPIERSNLTLITDAWTAETILKKLGRPGSHPADFKRG